MRVAIVIAAVIVGLFLLDRLLLAVEARGWIYYRRRQRIGTQIGGGIAAELGAILSPAERARQEAAALEEQIPEENEASGADPPA